MIHGNEFGLDCYKIVFPYDFTFSAFSPENLGKAVVDVKLREVEKEKEKLEHQIKNMLLEDDEMKKHISDLEDHLDVANQNIHSLKSCKLELEEKVCSKLN